MSAESAQGLLADAWLAVVAQPPSVDTAQLLTAHWALETDAGRSMPGYNFAGIKASSSAAAGATFRTIEGYGATRREINAKFRSYSSPEAGARDYVRLLKTRYPVALDAARAGDTAAFAHALGAGGYFTADPKAYSEGLLKRRHELAMGLAAAPSLAPQPAGLLAEVALGGLLQAFRGALVDS